MNSCDRCGRTDTVKGLVQLRGDMTRFYCHANADGSKAVPDCYALEQGNASKKLLRNATPPQEKESHS